MVIYPRIIRRLNRYRFRRFRSTRFFRRTPNRRNRIIRRALRRRPVRPEIKYVTLSGSPSDITTGTNIPFNITPTVITQGVGQGNRVGNSLTYRQISMNMFLRGPVTADPGAPYDNFVRMILWTPRIDYDRAYTYMSLIGYGETPDFNVVTVHYDRYHHLAYSHAESGPIASGVPDRFEGSGMRSTKMVQFKRPFPRHVRFSNVSPGDIGVVDVDKDIMYCTFINNFSAPLRFFFTTKVTYTDA